MNKVSLFCLCAGTLSLASCVGDGKDIQTQVPEDRYHMFQIENKLQIVFIPGPMWETCQRFADHAKAASNFRRIGLSKQDVETTIKTVRNKDGSLAKTQPDFRERWIISAATEFAYQAPLKIPAEEMFQKGLHFCVTEGYPLIVLKKGIEV